MGEVYRADDLTLEQPVALKFLPDAWARNADAIARFRNEVRVARQVSHPNVCRVYDLGEFDGQWFLSMEYVDGEDLGSLLRRIGRLPADKALEIARKLCAGLAAAHDKGILHRDLKPSNVMLDNRGQVLLTDFGLAALAGEITGSDISSGTPAYMAPEQLAGQEVTTRSDIYSLGLVLYEIFTGKLPFDSDTLDGLKRARLESTPVSLTTLVGEIDPTVERVILRCLQSKPSLRPPSAISVAAALPGGDPLAAALAAGETPSPEMVVAAGEGEGLSPKVAIPAFVLVLVGMAVVSMMSIRVSTLELVAPRYSPEVLREKARDLLPKLGYTAEPHDDNSSLGWYEEFFNSLDAKTANWKRLASGEPALLRFTYRTSPGPMTASEFHTDLLTPGIVSNDDPPITAPGMTYSELDHHGHLMYFEARPPQVVEPVKDTPATDWKPLLAAAGLDESALKSTEPLWTWLTTSDIRTAWTGTWPGTSLPMRVEAAAFRGKPVGFYVLGPWSKPWRKAEPEKPLWTDTTLTIEIVLLMAILIGAPLLARKNLVRGRGDRRGAARLALFIFAVHMAIWLCLSHVILSLGTFGMFLVAIATSTFAAVLVWLVYLALEPFVRRTWPRCLIASSSVLSGRINDAVVGRDVLIGMVASVVIQMIARAENAWLHNGKPNLVNTEILPGVRATLGSLLQVVPRGVRNAILFLFVLFLLRTLLRNQWVAALVFAAIFVPLAGVNTGHILLDATVGFLVWTIVALVLLRFGLLAMAVQNCFNIILSSIPITTHTSAWYFPPAAWLLVLLTVWAVWALRTSMKGHRLFRQDLFS